MAQKEAAHDGAAQSRAARKQAQQEGTLAGHWVIAGIGTYLVSGAAAALFILVAAFPVRIAAGSAAAAETANAAASGASASSAEAGLRFSAVMIGNRELIPPLATDSGLVLLALVAGILGSFMHAAQSFAKYVGNRQLTTSWGVWYLLRPLIGGVIGVLFYFVIRAGLLNNATEAVSPYGVVAFAGMAGWFSKQANDKLAELFTTLFRTEKNDYRDPLTIANPTIETIATSVDPLTTTTKGIVTLTITGTGFERGDLVEVSGHLLLTNVIDHENLTAELPERAIPETPGMLEVRVVRPAAPSIRSDPKEIEVVEAVDVHGD